MEIRIPEKLTPLDSLNFEKYLAVQHREREFIYDFNNMQHCPAFGMLVVANAIRRNISAFPHAKHIPINYTNTQGASYAGELGFFQMCGWDIGRLPTTTAYGESYIPIKKISISDLQERYLSSTIILGEMIDCYSYDLAMTLTQDPKSNTTATIQYCLREMIRNSYEHGHTNEVWVCGQYWSTRRNAQIAILDTGCGVFKSLRQNRHYNPRNDMDANKLALQPGVTCAFGKKQDAYDIWNNSGYGLFMASSICCLGGSFWLCSGTDATLVNSSGQYNYTINHTGTAVCLDIKLDKLDNIDHLLPEIAQKGNKEAAEHGEQRMLTASKVSTIASILQSPVSSDNKNEID